MLMPSYRWLIGGLLLLMIGAPLSAQTVEGAGSPFELVTLELEGPALDERSGVNPFADVRLDWTVTRGDESWTMPGYFAGCGDAADTGCTGGNVWRAHFVPPLEGEYSWKVEFRRGADMAISPAPGERLAGNGAQGSFSVSRQSEDPVRGRGLLQYTGESYYRFSGDGSIFFKFGPDAPENMLAYDGFDATPNYKDFRKSWDAHAADLRTEGRDYLWGKDGSGSGLLGMFDYLVEAGANSVSMLLWNAGGDDRNVFPHLMAVTAEEYEQMEPRAQWNEGLLQDRFDISKLAQWQRALSYADKRGLHMHFKLQETENDSFMDEGALGRTRKLFLREMVARFGHFLALTWNLGEENVQHPGDVRHMASYLAALDPYDHPLVLHSYPDQKQRYRAFLGPDTALNGLSLQGREDDISDLRFDVINWITTAKLAGKPLVMAYDEPGRADGGAGVDPDYPDDKLPSKRELELDPELFIRDGLWNALTAGANGVEAYYGYKTGCSDLDCQDHRTRARLWREGQLALDFFRDHVGERAARMIAADHLTRPRDDFVFAEPGEFLVIVPGDEQSVLVTGGIEGRFRIRWFDRANGGALQVGSVSEVENRQRNTPIGSPPEGGSGKWVAVVERVDTGILVEAEDFVEQRANDVRSWCRSAECPEGWERDGADDYVVLLPDTRVTHDDELVHGENFSAEPGKMAILSYDVEFPAAGRWYLWVRTHALGTEDNGIHAGLNGEWPESGARVQYCEGRGRWHWDSRQRTRDNHCGVKGGLWLDVPSAGKHRVEFSMREDGFSFDAFYLTLSPYMPDALRRANEETKTTPRTQGAH
ncbi:DUF5060 domain-containing protein [Altererythrobacter ishigakiensis]|uniref:Uncharacterized protein DUF5060 n=1 Tax=Altererythrobacter ishigakiensis TaxID=476157 RepID=A0A562UM25_9SPHN|nr:DUF5060 domain-containing protein [Altererythrobacter ishigakiensis]TWJ06668.1 uncharacterized protein DUF5060 [Altererythrobacter ishigakiensis]